MSQLEGQLKITTDDLTSEEKLNEKLRSELNDLKTTYESESVRVNLLEKQSSEQNRQKEIIINVNQLKDGFLSLKAILEDSLSDFSSETSKIIANQIEKLEEKINQLSSE